MLRSVLAKGLAVKVALVLAATGSTGVVVATSTGALPVPWAGTPASPPATSHSATPSAPPSVTPTRRPSDAGKPADIGAAPAPSIAGLCQAYEAQSRENPGKALESPAFTALVDAAGDAGKVPAYCDSLPDEQPAGRPSDLPTPTEHDRGSSPATRPAPPDRPDTPEGPTDRTPPTARQNGS